MINDVANFFKKQVGMSKEIRERSYDMFVHRVRIKNNTIQNIMAKDVIEICETINAKAGTDVLLPREGPIKTLIGNQVKKHFTENKLNYQFNKFANAKRMGRDHIQRVSVNVKKLQKGKNYYVKASSRQCEITVAQGLINMSNTYAKEGKKGSYNVVLASFRRLYGMCLNDIRQQIIAKAKVAGASNKDTKNVSHITSEYLLIRGHGVTAEGGARPDKRQGQQTTTGILDNVDKLDQQLQTLKKQYDSDSGAKTMGAQLLEQAFEQTIGAYKDVLEKNFELRKFYNPDKMEWNEDLIIEMEIISRAKDVTGGMAQRAMDPFDYKGVAADLEKAVTETIKKKVPLWARLWHKTKGSATREEMYVQKRQNQLIQHLLVNVKDKKSKGKGGVDFRLRVNKKLLQKLPKSAKGKAGFTIGKLQSAITAKAAKDYKAKFKKAKAQKGQGRTAESPIALRNILNEALPQMVASKMTPPALQFRTGRFANSARVENVNIGPRGGIGIDYTYMRNPYETFEPGGKQGSTQRDPRKIIGASIRELAMGIIGRQPTTIRRN